MHGKVSVFRTIVESIKTVVSSLTEEGETFKENNEELKEVIKMQNSEFIANLENGENVKSEINKDIHERYKTVDIGNEQLNELRRKEKTVQKQEKQNEKEQEQSR